MSTFLSLTVTTEGTATVNERGSEDTLAHLQSQVGGFIELVRLKPNLDMYLDEDGMGKRLPPNFPGTLMADYYGFNQGRPLLGPVVFTGGTDSAGETMSLTPDQTMQLTRLAARAVEVMNEQAF